MMSRLFRRARLAILALSSLAFGGCHATEENEPSLAISSPPGSLVAGSSYTIQWSASHLGSNRQVELRADVPGASYVIASGTPNDGSYTWTVGELEGGGALVPGSYVLVVTYYDPSGDDVWDTSSAFTLSGGAPSASIVVTDPPASLTAGNTYVIQWTSTGLGSGEVFELRADVPGASYVIASSTPNDGAYTWTVGQLEGGGALASGNYNLVVTWYNPGGSDAFDVSSTFAIP